MTKLTKKDKFGMLLELLAGAEVAEKDMLVEFIEAEVGAIERKAEKAKGRPRKKAEDELVDVVAGLLTDELKTIAVLVAEIADADVTTAKVTARLTALVKAGVAVKEDVKVDKRTVKGYKLA